jgi:hypothetical protein
LPFSIHISFDLWTSPNHRSFLGIVGHWATTTGELRSGTLGFYQFQGPHTGANIAEALWHIFERYDITKQIGYITTDNASNNDMAMLELSKYFQSAGVDFDPIAHRVCCFGHIINLVVKAFLWGSDWKTLETCITSQSDIDREVITLQAWRKRGPLGKLHNIAT